ncbi:hypothetical protein GPECTOR_5g327 [Gonium pectorale]|uniref:Amine oxidase domain-containing protein n=1 Tax=Gonium pectorale TaxID=33097 RepID=A0A150GWG3_GONPE|nr:hypothetical protein GPECTOR_5g327 [Gonium pectorale]|eukprot:KXZ54236.1 hypothetical protein GPECTOR_5g327 [Gonium pectorale]
MAPKWAVAVGALLAALFSVATAGKCATEFDVCVVGAGGAGLFTAVRLKQMGYRALVLEKADRVGGHCYTWTEPNTGAKIETGVVLYCDIPLVVDTFKRFNVTLVPYDPTGSAGQSSYRVSPSGQWLSKESVMNVTAYQKAFELFLGLMSTRFAYIETENGEMPDFDKLPPATVQMLLRPFGELLDSLDKELGPGALEPLYDIIGRLLQIGPGPMREVSALVALRNLRPAILKIMLGQGYTVKNGCSSLYHAFHRYLGGWVKLGAAPFSITRRSSRMDVTYTREGRKVKTTCRRLVVSAVQSLDNLESFINNLDAKEKAVFSQVTYNIFSKAVVRTPYKMGSNPKGVSVQLSEFGYKDLPAVVALGTMGPLGVGLTWTVGPTPVATRQGIADLIISNLTTWSAAVGGAFPIPAKRKDVFLDGPDLHQHTPRPADMTQLPAFYNALYGLQGHRNTYYTGALLSHNAQYDVWRYSDWLVRNVTWSC